MQRLNADGVEETVQLTGLDALLADGVMTDPLQGNYRLVSLDKLMWSVYRGNALSLQTYELVTPTLSAIPGSGTYLGNHRFYDTAAGDLNGDLQDEQIAAWIGAGNQIYLFIGEMPGSLGRVTSAPAVVSSDGGLDLVVRGYDDALWYHDGASWYQVPDSRLLSGPGIASRAAGQFDVFAVGLDDSVAPNYLVVWHNHRGVDWSGWEALDNPDEGNPPPGWPTVERDVPTPEFPAPVVVASGSNQLDLFWLWPDNTLRWRHFNGVTWSTWQNLGGMLASGPGAVAHDGQIDVFARGVDEALWTLTYRDGNWERRPDGSYNWQRVDRAGMLGGVTIASAPAVVSPAAGQVLVVVRGSDDRLWQLAYDGSSWGNWNLAGPNKSTSGRVGQALGLDGVDDYVDLPDNFPNTNGFTFAAWVYWNGGNAWQRIFDFGQNACSSMFLTPSNGTNARFAITKSCGAGEQRLNTSIPITPTEWVHVAVTLNGITGTLYMNGSAVASGAITLTARDVVGANTWLGKSQYPDPAFAGKIDEVAVFTRSLSTSEIASIYSSGWDSVSGKVLGLHLDENPATHGTTLTDVSGSGNDGTLYAFGNSELTGAPAAVVHGGQIDIFARTSDGHLGNLRYDSSTWTDWANFEGLGIAAVVYPTDALAWTIPITDEEDVQDFENVLLDVETGYFTGDGREQIVLAYQAAAGEIKIDLYDIHVGFSPTRIASLGTGVSISGAVPRIAAADVDGDGVDEIGLTSIIAHHEGKVQLRVFKFQRGTLPEPFFDSGVVTVVGPTDRFGGTLRIAGGDIVIDPDPSKSNDEFVVVSDWHHAGTYEDLITDMQLYDLDKTNFSPLTQTRIYAHNIDNPEFYLTGVGLAIGDVAGSDPGQGVDEIIVTWPRVFDNGDWGDLYRDLMVYGCCEDTGSLNEKGRYEVPSYSRISFLDSLAAGDLDQDAQEEIVLASHQGGRDYAQRYFLEVYEFGTLTDGPLDQYSLTLGPEWPLGFNMAMGDFTSESIRVGPPSYRVQEKMTTPVVFLNLPPMHRDIIKVGGVEQVVEVDNNAQAVHTGNTATGEVYSSESKREWELSRGLEMSVGGGGHTVKTSLVNTYDENFSSSTTEIREIEIIDQTTANLYDQVIYNATNYAVWEYPVYGVPDGSSDEAQTIAVVWPLVANNETNSPTTRYGTFCDESFYAPSHQAYNVWSYGPSGLGEGGFDDMGEMIDSKPTSGGTGLILKMSHSSTAARSASFHNQISRGLEYSYESELNIPIIGKVWDFSFRAYANGKYGHEKISTFSSQVTEDTGVSVNYPAGQGVPPIDIYMYWAKAGYMVVDYQTAPDNAYPWLHYDKPDPAFILPWYGFPNPANPVSPPCGPDKKLFTHDIELDPAYVQNGDTVIMTATVRNFSNVNPPGNVTVSFYLGYPAAGNYIDSCEISGANLDRDLGPQHCWTTWLVSGGSGEEKIYASIDPINAFDEMHDGDDSINNNIGYGLLYVANADYFDPGLRQTRTYQAIFYEDTPGLGYGLYLPTANITETIRYELVPTSIAGLDIVGSPIQVLAFHGGQQEPDEGHTFSPAPAGIMAFYRDSDLLPGMDENDLTLYRRDGDVWVEATCPGYTSERFLADNRIAVPLCRVGVFALFAERPQPFIFLPLVLKNAQ